MASPPQNGDSPHAHNPVPHSDAHSDAHADAYDAPDVVNGIPPVPVNVWRLTYVRRPQRGRRDGGLTPQLAVLILGVFTRPGDLVVDVADDAALAGVARAGARRYQPVPSPTSLVDVAGTETAARLIYLPWPDLAPPGTDKTGAHRGVTAALDACRHLLVTDGRLIVALSTTLAQPTYVGRYQQVITAADQAALTYTQHIVVHHSDENDVRADAPSRETTVPSNLLLFMRRGGPP